MKSSLNLLLFILILLTTACDDKKESSFELVFDQEEVQFGKAQVNQYVTKKVRIKNTENSTGTFTGKVKIVDSPAFSTSFNTLLTLQKNESKEIDVTFSPIAGQVYSGKMNILDEDENFVSEIYLYGEGITPVSFSLDKSKLEFGLVKSGNSKSLDILITNNASSGLDLELSLSIPVSDFTISNNIQSLVISPGVAENLTIKYSPTVSISDKYLIINHNSLTQQNPLTIQLIGIMNETESIVAKIEEGWTYFEQGNYYNGQQSFQEAMNKSIIHTSYDSVYGESMHGRGWSTLFNTSNLDNAEIAYNDFVSTAKDYSDKISNFSLLDCLAGKAISGVLVGSSVERYEAVVDAAKQLLYQNQNYIFSHKKSVDHKDVRMALIQSYYYLGNYIDAAKQMDILDPSNAPHPTNAALLLAAIQALSGSI